MLQGYVGSFCHIPINKKKERKKNVSVFLRMCVDRKVL